MCGMLMNLHGTDGEFSQNESVGSKPCKSLNVRDVR